MPPGTRGRISAAARDSTTQELVAKIVEVVKKAADASDAADTNTSFRTNAEAGLLRQVGETFGLSTWAIIYVAFGTIVSAFGKSLRSLHGLKKDRPELTFDHVADVAEANRQRRLGNKYRPGFQPPMQLNDMLNETPSRLIDSPASNRTPAAASDSYIDDETKPPSVDHIIDPSPLQSGRWLNDNIVNVAIELATAASPNNFVFIESWLFSSNAQKSTAIEVKLQQSPEADILTPINVEMSTGP
ncbi:hypothetical protein LY76DRAFT_610399 [Colletotrichum caudatum]|nr:hypothetical protein LY76DRAFT_610399 [Colletotrichum caudatum]